jgi:Zn-dependent protease
MGWQPNKPNGTGSNGSGNGSGERPDNVYKFQPRKRPKGEWPISASFMGLCTAFIIMGGIMMFMPQYARGAVFPFVVAGWVISLCLHEFGHAFTAYKYGDVTVKDQGYLTLDPLKYADPLTSILFPILIVAMGGIGLPGGSVYVKTQLFRESWQRAAMSAAGPFMNLVFLMIVMAFLHLVGAPPVLFAALSFIALLQITSFVFNLLPIPGFDGWGVIEPWLPQNVREFGYQFAPIAMILVLLAAFAVPGFFSFVWSLARMIGEPVGLDFRAAGAGLRLFQFWK